MKFAPGGSRTKGRAPATRCVTLLLRFAKTSSCLKINPRTHPSQVAVGDLAAASAISCDPGAALAQMDPDLRVPFQHCIEFSPQISIRDRPAPPTQVRTPPLRAVPAPDVPPSAAAFDHVGGVCDDNRRRRRRVALEPGCRLNDRHDFEGVVQGADHRSGGSISLVVAVHDHEARPPERVAGAKDPSA